MWGALAAVFQGVLSFFFKLAARPAGAVDAEDAPDQEEINDEIDNLPPLP